MELSLKAAGILHATIYAVVATSSTSGEPWNSPLFVVFDDALYFYWASARASRHSNNIHENPRIFLVFYDSHAKWSAGQAVFVQATASEVDDPAEIAAACQLRKARVAAARHTADEFSGGRPRRIYRAVPQKMWINRASEIDGQFVDERVALDIRQLQSLLVNPNGASRV